jgi:hypothetical protein
MSTYCATCGRQRNGSERSCAGCGAQFADASAPPGGQGPDAVGPTVIDHPVAEPDPFASWYQPQPRGGAQGAVPGDDSTWQQPTQTVNAPPTRPAGFLPPPQAPSAPPYPPYQPAQPYQPYPPASGPPRRGRGGLFIVLAVIAVLAAGGGAYALANSLGKHSTAQPSPPSTGGSTTAGGTGTAGGTPTGGSASSGGPAQATTPAGSQTPSPALSLVTIGQGVTSSAATSQVETLLSHYFHGINTRDYAEYASTLNPAEQAKQSQSHFKSGYATTTDSEMTLTSLASGGSGRLVATVTFTSHQSPAQSVDHSACNAWTLNFYLVPQGTGYLIGPAPSGYTPSHADC